MSSAEPQVIVLWRHPTVTDETARHRGRPMAMCHDDHRGASRARRGPSLSLGVLVMHRRPDEPEDDGHGDSEPSTPGSLSRALKMPRSARAVRSARHWVRRTLTEWALGAMADQAEQIVGELATNALDHAQGELPIVLLLMYAAGTLRVEVFDKDPVNVPIKGNPESMDVGGRGLILVEAFSHRWGTRVTDEGKSVWAELDITRPGVTQVSGGSLAGKENLA